MKRALQIIACAAMVSCAEGQPWEPDMIWSRNGATDSAHYGTTVFALGDQNDDSLNDWGVLAFGPIAFEPEGDSAYVELFHGGNPPSTTPYMSFTGNRPTDYINWANGIGDVNGDGYLDWYIDRKITGGQPPKHVQIYFGGPDADTLIDVEILAAASDWVRPIGDFNGDGYDDSYIYRESQDAADVFFGGGDMDSLADWRTHSAPGTPSSYAYAVGGDLNHDGFDDWVGGDPNTNYVYVYLGSANPDTSPAFVWDSMPPVDILYPKSIVHDLNGDEYDDLIFNYGYVVFGAEDLEPMVGQRVWINSLHQGLPDAVVSAGDINLDGFGDLLMLNPYQESGCWGEVSVHLGASWINPDPFYHYCGSAAPYNVYGPYSAAAVGDVNGDHVDDLLFGGPEPYDNAPQRGRAVILAGDSTVRVSADDQPEIVERFSISVYPNPFNSSTTIELSLPRSSSPLELTLYNALGQVAYHETLQPVTSTLRHVLSADGLASGVYVLACRAGDLTATKKLLLMK